MPKEKFSSNSKLAVLISNRSNNSLFLRMHQFKSNNSFVSLFEGNDFQKIDSNLDLPLKELPPLIPGEKYSIKLVAISSDQLIPINKVLAFGVE